LTQAGPAGKIGAKGKLVAVILARVDSARTSACCRSSSGRSTARNS
jgi:hypothetical protein